MKEKPVQLWDLTDPGWREREVEHYKALAVMTCTKCLKALARNETPMHNPLGEISRRTTPCGECHLQPGERCDICGARDVRG